ncbi:MAG TPA: VCBS repeat-containing protein [Candidatus Udaeobacter sp.]|nr:VCBS repeat-containing protein [Candidatus Udaeobacter sp.]
MRHGFSVRGSIILAGGVVLGLVVPGGNTNLQGQNKIVSASPAFEAGVTTHETRIDLQTESELPSVTETLPQTQIEIPAPTRSTFMASWPSVKGALGYLLDVSASDSFGTYVDGYHDLDVGNVTARGVTGLNRGTTYYYRVRAYGATGPGDYSGVMTSATEATTGLNINPTFDTSITNNPNAAAIEAMINRAISICESLFSDPITIQIRFRYSTTAPNGTPLPAGTLSRSDFVIYSIPWSTLINALRADARTSNDNRANASLPGNALSANIKPASADGRALGLNTPPAMFANGAVGNGGPYDGIVTLNSSKPFRFIRPPSANYFDAQRATEHEMDEVIGIGSHLNINGSDLRPQDLFSWSSAGIRNVTSSGARYFSINGGVTNIVNFNQNVSGDFGDWLSEACPQTHPYVQNAFSCTGQSSDIAVTSPEGINLDVIGYDLVNAPPPSLTAFDFNNDGHPDYLLYNSSTRQTAVWFMSNNIFVSGAYGPTLPAGWSVVSVADFNRDGHPDYALFNPSTRQTAIWFLSGVRVLSSAYGPTLPSGWELVATGDFNGDGKPDYVLYKASTGQTAIWYMNNAVFVSGAYGPTLPAGWSLVGAADFDRNGHTDYLLFNSITRQTAIWYLSGPTFLRGAYGPTLPSGWELVGTADFNGNGHPDYVLYHASTHQTAIWYLNNNVFVSGAYGPTLPAAWSLAAP